MAIPHRFPSVDYPLLQRRIVMVLVHHVIFIVVDGSCDLSLLILQPLELCGILHGQKMGGVPLGPGVCGLGRQVEV